MPAGPRPARNRLRSWAAWGGVVIVVALALAVGAGALGGARQGAPSLYERTLQVAGQYRCPVCQGESAASSDAAPSVEIRDQIRAWLQEGRSEAQIRTFMVKDYGSSILEKPPASGAGLFVWLIPAIVVGAALLGLGLAFARWRQVSPEPATTELAVIGPATTEPVAIEPATTEPAATELGRTEQGSLFDPDEFGERVTTPARRASSFSQRFLLVAGLALVLLAAVLWRLDLNATHRSPGQSETGGVTNSTGSTAISSELVEADALAIKDPVAALVLYDEVLKADPSQPVALTAAGWIYAESGYVKEGLAMLAKAEVAQPSYPPPHLYRGLVLLTKDHQPAQAATELRWYLHHSPAAAEVSTARTALALAEAQQEKK